MTPSDARQDSRKALREAWALRMALRIEDCRRAVRGIKAQAFGDRQAEYEALLLDASLARADGDLSGSARSLAEARAAQLRDGLEPHFHWDFQAANNAYLQGQFGSALELFLRARTRARDPFEAAAAAGSALLCAEALGLGLGGRLEETSTLAALVTDRFMRESLDEQIEAFRMREHWRLGRPAEIWRGRDVSARSQSRWMQAWAAELPFMAPPAGAPAWQIEDFDPEMNAFRYRLGTLSGRSEPDESAKAQLKAERLYLWTWRWLRDADVASLGKVEETLSSISLYELRSRSAIGDLQLISLSLRWLAAFFPKAGPAIARGLARFEPPDMAWPPAWEFERRLAEASALPPARREKALLPILEDPLATATGFAWRQALARVASARPNALVRGRRSSSGLTVDLVNNKIYLGSASNPMAAGISAPLCCLFASLREGGGVLGFEEALEACFGISPYETDAHRPKIHNLLARARKFLPAGASLLSRSEAIYWQGDLSSLVIVKGERPLRLPSWFRARTEMTAVTAKHLDRWIRPSAVLKHAKPGRDLTRKEMERLANCSKATAHRLLSAWERQGLLVRKGRGKRARYQIELAEPDEKP